MTDVMKKAVDANDIKQGSTFAGYGAGNGVGVKLFEDDYDYEPLVSGVNGAATNNYLDNRFDDYAYYV